MRVQVMVWVGFSCAESRTEEETYIIKQLDLVFQIGGSFSLIEQLIDLVVNHYTDGKKRELRIQAKMRLVDGIAGIPRGGIRCIKCPRCGEIRMHTHVICPVCAEKGDISWLVLGCRDRGCHANETEMERLVQNPLPVVEMKSWTCTGLDRHSLMEIRTSVPLDMISQLCLSNQSSLFVANSRSAILLLIRYAIANKKSSYLTTANMALVFEKLGEKELFEVLSKHLKEQLSHDHENGCLDDFLLKCGSVDSIERELFGLAFMDSLINRLGAKGPQKDSQAQHPPPSTPPSVQETRTPPTRECVLGL